MLLHEHTTTTFGEVADDVEVALLPTGSTEQHGPALALGMDHLAAETIARSIDRPDTVVLPTLPVGVSGHHRQFHGTLSVSDETFARFVRETLESLAGHGVRKAVVVNGHGGNTGALARVQMGLRRERTAIAVPWNWWEGVPDTLDELFDENGGHADAVESSLLWHIREDLVRPDALAEAEELGGDGWGEFVEGAMVGIDTLDFTESGAIGSPTAAAPEKGEQLFDAASASLARLVGWLAGQPVEDLLPKEHK